MKYAKPDVYVERFVPNSAIAQGCQYVDGTDPTATTVQCIIGNQSETIFNTGTTGCSTAASKWKFLDREGTNNDYLVWFTYEGDTGSAGQNPDTSVLAGLVVDAGLANHWSDVGSGWHYAKVISDGTEAGWTETVS